MVRRLTPARAAMSSMVIARKPDVSRSRSVASRITSRVPPLRTGGLKVVPSVAQNFSFVQGQFCTKFSICARLRNQALSAHARVSAGGLAQRGLAPQALGGEVDEGADLGRGP